MFIVPVSEDGKENGHWGQSAVMHGIFGNLGAKD